VQRWRLVVARDAVAPEAQRALQASWETALRDSGLPVAGLDAAAPRARIAVAAPLTASVRGEAELVDIWLTERCPAWRVREAVAGVVPAGFRLRDVYDVWLGEPALPGQVVASVFRADIDPDTVDLDGLRAAARDLMAASSLLRTRRKGDRNVEYDLRPFLGELNVSTGQPGRRVGVRMHLRHDPERGVGRPEEVIAALAERIGEEIAVLEVVRERLVLAADDR
jgi:radical SAM-linked protein